MDSPQPSKHPSSSASASAEAVTCPALTLPVELTSEIFLHCASVSTLPPDAKLCKPMDNPPFVLTRICSEWRLIALSMPGLWRDVHLEFRSSGPRVGHINAWWVSFLETWLSRAQSQPLGITISNLSHTDPNPAFFGLLDSHRQRWQSLAIHLAFSAFHHFSADDALPILERLRIGAHNVPRNDANPITAFQRAPLLHHVVLGGGLRPSHFTLPWAQLTNIELSAARAEDCVECLHQAPRITTCTFEIHDPGSPASIAPIPPLLHLRSLTLSGTYPTTVLHFAAMPALENLDVAGRSLNAEDLSRISFFASRSECQLRAFQLHFISHPLTAAALTLLETPPFRELETLDLSATEAKTIITFLQRLDDDDAQTETQAFLPQLQTLALSHHRMRDEDMHAMFNVVATVLRRRSERTPEHVQLRAFSMTMQFEETAPRLWVRKRLRRLVQQGMDISVGNRHERWV
ncbi:hypothetical protein C8R46DRAFT_1353779 [Mycena filopes]|nr:hypothetical protein C8R46DRAFT_1353779 [Mycena filopes]